MPLVQKLSLKMIAALCLIICLVLLFSAFQVKAHQSIEWDEGAYLTTFKLVQSGFPLYQPTFFSQPPGFFYTIFPLYSLFGSTLDAARMAVFLYSLIGLLAMVWISWELENPLAGFVAICIVYLIPIYTTEIMTLHADSLPSTFSAVALASILRWRHSTRWGWIALSGVFAAAALLIKADVTILPSIGLALLFITKPKTIKNVVTTGGIFSVALLVSFLVLALPFGLNSLYSNLVTMRIQASATSAADPSLFISLLQQQSIYIILIAIGLVSNAITFIIQKEARLPLLILLAWPATTFIFLLIYHPLFSHHLVLLAVPVSLVVAYPAGTLLSRLTISKLIYVPVGLLVIALPGYELYQAWASDGNSVLNDQEIRGVTLIQEYTQPGDYIISDDELISALSDRLTPPPLADVSRVRIRSGNLTVEAFEHSLNEYKPKVILAWTYRLSYLPNFEQIMQQYHYQMIQDPATPLPTYVLRP